jgi:uncharacterized protein (TIGR03084 family)
MKQISSELLGEYRLLAELCEALKPEQWRLSTDFYHWTPWDEIAHLAFFDETGMQAATDPQRFGADKEALEKELTTGEGISAITRRRFRHMDGPALLRFWRERHEAVVAALSRLDSKARPPWYGPDISARSFATSRLMETWAHGQDIWDALERERGPSPRLRNIVHLGVSHLSMDICQRQAAGAAAHAVRGPHRARWRPLDLGRAIRKGLRSWPGARFRTAGDTASLFQVAPGAAPDTLIAS